MDEGHNSTVIAGGGRSFRCAVPEGRGEGGGEGVEEKEEAKKEMMFMMFPPFDSNASNFSVFDAHMECSLKV